VAGVEADFGWANETANLHGSLHRSCSTSESDWAVALASEQSLTALPVVIAHDKAALLVPQVQGHRSLLNQHIGGTAHTKKIRCGNSITPGKIDADSRVGRSNFVW